MARRKQEQPKDAAAFADVPIIFQERLNEKLWTPDKGKTTFRLRALNNAENLYALSSMEQGRVGMLKLKIGVVDIKQEGSKFEPEVEELNILGVRTQVLTDASVVAIPSVLIPALLDLIQMLTEQSAEEIEKLDFFLPLSSGE